MLKWLEERDWEKAIMAVMPQRKFKDGKKKTGKEGEDEGQAEDVVDSGEELEQEQDDADDEGREALPPDARETEIQVTSM